MLYVFGGKLIECITNKLISQPFGLSLKLGDSKNLIPWSLLFLTSIYLNKGGSLKNILSLSSPFSLMSAPVYSFRACAIS